MTITPVAQPPRSAAGGAAPAAPPEGAQKGTMSREDVAAPEPQAVAKPDNSSSAAERLQEPVDSRLPGTAPEGTSIAEKEKLPLVPTPVLDRDSEAPVQSAVQQGAAAAAPMSGPG